MFHLASFLVPLFEIIDTLMAGPRFQVGSWGNSSFHSLFVIMREAQPEVMHSSSLFRHTRHGFQLAIPVAVHVTPGPAGAPASIHRFTNKPLRLHNCQL